MNCGNFSEIIKSCVWLGFKVYNLDLEIITSPPITACVKDSITFGFLEDEFELFVVKALDSTLSVAVYRNRQNSNERPDSGYALRFYFTLIGFDEEPQTAIMNHDKERSNPPATFEINESVLTKINNTHHVFELFVVVQMLEFENLHKNHARKKEIDSFMSLVARKASKRELKSLRYILKTPDIENNFTGRLPSASLTGIMCIITMMAKNFPRIAEYFRTRENGDSTNENLSSILKYFGLVAADEGSLPPEEATEHYLLAHKLGLDCYKTVVSDYLVSILDHDYDVLDVLEASLMVHDEDLFKKAAKSFLNRFHEITRSGKFQYFTRSKAMATRLIIHSVRVWVANNDVYIPGWTRTTEL